MGFPQLAKSASTMKAVVRMAAGAYHGRVHHKEFGEAIKNIRAVDPRVVLGLLLVGLIALVAVEFIGCDAREQMLFEVNPGER